MTLSPTLSHGEREQTMHMFSRVDAFPMNNL